MTGHVFISYSHTEAAEYVERLGKYLEGAGVAVWYDKEILSGDRWRHEIRERIDTCSAVIVLMTPGAEQSPWVNREIVRAENMTKPVVPLLLRGTAFFGLGDLQYEDVTAGGMPSDSFVTRLRDLLPQPTSQLPQASTADDPADLTRRFHAAQAVAASGDRAEAANLFYALYSDYHRVLGGGHPETLLAEHEWGFNMGEAGERSRAVRLLRLVVDASTANLGADHPSTLLYRGTLARNMEKSGEGVAAADLYEKLAADNARVLGPNHPNTVSSRNSYIALTSWATGI